jgi:purine-binding chemotaxis protein CheW
MARRRHRPDLERSYVGFRLGDAHYAVPIARVREIITPSPTTPLPEMPSAVMGVVEHRGEVVPVVDAGLELGLGPVEQNARQRWVLVAIEKRSVALAVDRVTEVFGTDAPIRPAPKDGEASTLLGVVQHEGELVFVLDTTRFARLVEELGAFELPLRRS